MLEQAQYFARLAEWMLLEALGLFASTHCAVSVRTLHQSFDVTGRLDAEYYQPKYQNLLNHLESKPCVRLGEIVNLYKSIEPGSDAYTGDGVPFVRVADLSKFGIGQTDKYLNPKDFNDVIRPKRNTILLSKDGTVGVAYCVPDDMDVITSGAIVHLQIKPECHDEICPWYLTLVLNSMVVQLQAQRDAGGSIIQHWKPSEILAVVIPKPPKSTQQMIADRLKASFMLKTQSEKLLEQAKKLVEQTIENLNC